MIGTATTARIRTLMIFLSLALLSACAQNPSKIGHSVTLCCPGNYSDYQAYGLETVNMPRFFRDYVIEEFDKAFQEKGLVRNDRINDLQVTLRYRHVNLRPEQEEVDPFVRQENINVELSYIATVIIEMRETATGNLVWEGQIHRIHRVSPGEYMHEDAARGAFLMAFREVLGSYPALD